MNWRATPLASYRVIIDLISATITKTGLKVYCEVDESLYPKGVVVSDEQMDSLNITRAEFHGEWNYAIAPSNQPNTAVSSWQAPSSTLAPPCAYARKRSKSGPRTRLPDRQRAF